MRDLHVGALAICGTDDRLHGIITDRDIVVRCVAEGGDPTTVTAGQLARGTPIWVRAGADVGTVLGLMEEHKIRRLPVLREHRLVGMISEADLATHPGEHRVARYTTVVYAAPPTLWSTRHASWGGAGVRPEDATAGHAGRSDVAARAQRPCPRGTRRSTLETKAPTRGGGHVSQRL